MGQIVDMQLNFGLIFDTQSVKFRRMLAVDRLSWRPQKSLKTLRLPVDTKVHSEHRHGTTRFTLQIWL